MMIVVSGAVIITRVGAGGLVHGAGTNPGIHTGGER